MSIDPTTPQRIAIIARRIDGDGGPTAVLARDTAMAMHAQGHDVTVLVGHCPSELRPSGLRIEQFARRRVGKAHQLHGLARWASHTLQDRGLDLSIAFGTFTPADVVVAPQGFETGYARPRTLAEFHVPPWMRLHPRHALLRRARLRLEARTMADARTRRVAVPSMLAAEHARALFGLEAPRLVVIRPGLPPPPSQAEAEAARRRIRTGFHVPKNSTVFAFAATEPEAQGIDALVDAIGMLAAERSDFNVLIAGAVGYAVHTRIGELSARERVRFIGTTRHEHDLIAAADVAVLPSLGDAASRFIAQALQQGRPVIASPRDGSTDWISRMNAPQATGASDHAPTPSAAQAASLALPGLVLDDPADARDLADVMSHMCAPAAREASAAQSADRAELDDALSIERFVREILEQFRDLAG